MKELKAKLTENVNAICAMIDLLTEEELFNPHIRKWADEATKTAVWEVYKFIHVNTVAPFGTFRTKIRKWNFLYVSNYKIVFSLGAKALRLFIMSELRARGISTKS